MIEVIRQHKIILESDTCLIAINKLYHIPIQDSFVQFNFDDYNCVYFVSKYGVPNKKNLKNEYKMLSKLKHKNIVRALSYDIDSNILRIEYIDGYDLIEFININLLKSIHIKYFFGQMIRAVNYCHEKNIIHCDIKLENFMVNSKNKIKLIDFEFAIKKGSSRNLCGTIEYLAPELIMEYMNRNNETYLYTEKSDIWALGITLYCMVYKKHPFCDIKVLRDTAQNDEIANNILNVDITFSKKSDPNLVYLLKGMLDKNPAARYTIDIILKSPYLDHLKKN